MNKHRLSGPFSRRTSLNDRINFSSSTLKVKKVAAGLNNAKFGNRLISRRQFLGATIGSTILGISGLTYAHFIEPLWLEVSSVQLSLPRLKPNFSGYRIVQMSDIHLDNEQMDSARLAEIVDLVNQMTPDLIVVTGDFITASHHGGPKVPAKDLIQPLSKLKAADGTLAVLGNHDHEEDPVLVKGVVQESGMIDLSNAVHTIERGSSALCFAGVDDVLERQDDFDGVLDRLPEDGAAILLVHEPDFADTAANTDRFDLQLSGHSHGGQIALPWLGPIILPPYGRRYAQGLYRIRDMMLYTNRGLGTVPPNFRLNCRPEITLLTLKMA